MTATDQPGVDPTLERKKRVVRRRRDMDFTPVRNGMDFLLSAFDHLSQRNGEPGARDLKYAVLHLQAAVEVLLKARLIREHWSLVFSDPGKAKRGDYEKGSFNSCTVLGAVDRLNNIVALQITQEQRKAIGNLADTRNALTHLGHTGSVYAIEAQAATVLDFLLNFIHEELRPVLSSEGPYVEDTMGELRTRLGQAKALVSQRLNRLQGELQGAGDYTVQCPECQQWALVLGDEPSCRFCLHQLDTAHETVSSYLDAGLASFDELLICPSCAEYLVVQGATVASKQSANVDICFVCATDYTAWRLCDFQCGGLVPPDREDGLCEGCWAGIADEKHS
ncbi:hypothetical protein [Streptomyces sp. KE1]|uniref:hypothetical protein n=1 Tax=Streptomyces sp. KE1 TaxID=1638939 RepID=UPI00131BFA67|nr:hypothetical protein [Streptomyces sp. KE1]